MSTTALPPIEQNIARCRLILSVAALVAVYVDPTEPLLSRWVALISGPFVMDPALSVIMGAHLAYSLLVYVALWRDRFSPTHIAMQTMWGDVLFGIAIAALTEGATSPFYCFFAFAVVAVGLRAGLRPAMLVTSVSVGLYGLYLCLILLSTGRGINVYIMRPVYLAITGYLVGYLGQHRLELEEEMRRRDAAEQRHRIGRDLHDSFAQALAGIDLRLESCRRLLRGNPAAEVLTDLGELQDSVKREFDELRTYTRALAGVEVTPTAQDEDAATRLSISANFSGSIDLVDHVLQIIREGINNVRRHAHAQTATVEIRADRSYVHVSVEDDGVGFAGQLTPWSIASRVKEIGGRIEIVPQNGRGAHLVITLPHA